MSFIPSQCDKTFENILLKGFVELTSRFRDFCAINGEIRKTFYFFDIKQFETEFKFFLLGKVLWVSEKSLSWLWNSWAAEPTGTRFLVEQTLLGW